MVQAQFDEPGAQLEQGAVDGATDRVTITIGGNDAGFAEVLRLCALNSCTDPSYRPYDDRPFTEWLAAEIDSLEPVLLETFRELDSAAANARVLVAGYPQLFPRVPEQQE